MKKVIILFTAFVEQLFAMRVIWLLMIFQCLGSLSGQTRNVNITDPAYPDVKKFGAMGNGKIDDTKSIQECFNSLPSEGGGVVIIPPGTYLVTKIRLPKLKSGQVVIWGYGATLKSTSNDTLLIRKPINQKEALDKLTNSSIIIEGLKVVGNGGDKQVGLYIGGSYSSSVQNCEFRLLQTGFELRFGLMTDIRNCVFHTCNYAGLIIDTGVGQWDKANGFNSQSNATTVSNCRFYNKKNQQYCIFTQNCSDLQFSNLVFEGQNPKVGLYIGSNTTVFKGLMLTGLHNECTEGDAMIKMVIPTYSGGVFKYSYIYNQMPVVAIDASQASGCVINVDMMLYMPEGCSFKKGKANWIFTYCNLWNPKNNKYWERETDLKEIQINY